MDIERFFSDIQNEVELKLKDKIDVLNATQGISASIENGNIKIVFDKDLAEDEKQDRAGVILKGGAILTKEGQEKKENGLKLTDKDFYLINPIGDKL